MKRFSWSSLEQRHNKMPESMHYYPINRIDDPSRSAKSCIMDWKSLAGGMGTAVDAAPGWSFPHYRKFDLQLPASNFEGALIQSVNADAWEGKETWR